MFRILKAGHPDIVLELMKDPFYKFDYKYVFLFINELLKQKDDNHNYARDNNE